jgi:hypothetical protein
LLEAMNTGKFICQNFAELEPYCFNKIGLEFLTDYLFVVRSMRSTLDYDPSHDAFYEEKDEYQSYSRFALLASSRSTQLLVECPS